MNPINYMETRSYTHKKKEMDRQAAPAAEAGTAAAKELTTTAVTTMEVWARDL